MMPPTSISTARWLRPCRAFEYFFVMPFHETGIRQPSWILRLTNRFTPQVEQQLTRVITTMDFARHKYLWRSISKRKCKRPKVEKLVMQRIQRDTVAFHRRSACTVPFYVR